MTAVAVAVCRLWVRDLAFTLGIGVRRVIGFVALAVLLAAGFGMLLAMVSGAALDRTVLPDDVVSGMVRSACAVAFGISAVIGVALHLAVPPFGALQVAVELSPLGRARSAIGTRLPVLAGATILSCALVSMSANVVVTTADGARHAALGLSALVLVVLISQCLSWASITLTAWVIGRCLRFRHQAATGTAGLVVIGLVVLLVYPEIFSLRTEVDLGFRPRDLLLHRGAALLAAGSLLGGLVVLGWMVVGVVAVRWAAGLEVDRDQPVVWPVGRRVRTPPGAALAAARLEAVQAVRSPHAVSVLIVMAACVGLGRWSSRMPLLAESSSLLVEAAFLPPFVLALFATGRSRAHQWVGVALTANRAWSTWPRLLGLAAVGACGGLATFLVVLVVADTPTLTGLTVARCLLVLSLALLTGAMIPYGDEQPMSAVAGVVGLALVLGVVGVVTSHVVEVGGAATGILVMLSLSVAGLAFYGLTVQRSEVMLSAV